MVAADQMEVSGAIFVPIGMKAHGSNPPVSQRDSLRATPGPAVIFAAGPGN
jgi:hypothetical protein